MDCCVYHCRYGYRKRRNVESSSQNDVYIIYNIDALACKNH